MINEKEIRSGSIFHDTASGKDVVLTFQIIHHTAGVVTLNMMHNVIDTLRPAPLTEEWHKKLGIISIEYSDLRNTGGYCKIIFEGLIIIECFLSKKIEYVHEIQNLYFTLKGEELPISEPEKAK